MAKAKTKEELEKEYKLKSESYERKLKRKHSKFIVFSLTLIVCGYLFFLLSPRLFQEKPEKYYTELGTAVNFTGGSITPNSWIYSKNGKMMQVEFAFKSNLVISPDIEVNAATSYEVRTKRSSKLTAEVIYHESDYYIANIYDVPDDYYCVSLRITTINNTDSQGTVISNDNYGLGDQVIDELNETKPESGSDKEISSTAVIYTCREDVETVNVLYPLDGYIYRIKRIQSNINTDYATISANNTAIEELNNEIAELKTKNEELTNEMLYMTSSEKLVNQRTINSNNDKINEKNTQIGSLQGANENLMTEIEEYSEIIRRISAEGEGRKYTEPTEPPSEPSAAPSEPLGTEAGLLLADPTRPPTEPNKAPTEPVKATNNK